MKILFNMAHPAQVHMFKHVIKKLEKNNNECMITSVNKEVSLQLLDAFGLKYETVGNAKSSLLSKGIELIKIERNLLAICKHFKPDILVGGSGNAYSAHIGKVIKKPVIIFEDSEKGIIEHILTNPFASVICTPSSFKKNIGEKHVRFEGYKELAYLHPNNFTPKSSVLLEQNLTENEPFVLLRFVEWNADHDLSHHGIKNKVEFVHELEKYARVLITSEGDVPLEIEENKIKVSPEKLHDLLFYSTMLIGDSQTMTTEAALLGVPAIRCNSFVGTNDMSNFLELENNYGLIFNFNDSVAALSKAIELLKMENLKKKWGIKRYNLLESKIDVTAFMAWFIENYPISFKQMKENPEIQYQFK